jgi:hypothetical protein
VNSAGSAGPLLYQVGSRWEPLPEWARFFRSVGQLCAASRDSSQRVIVGAVVPTRAFAASFVALGAVDARLNSAPEQASVDEHFAVISALPVGSHVTVQMAGKKYVATFVGRGERNGKEGINVRHEKDGVQSFLPAEVCHRVTLGRLGKETLAKRPRIGDSANHSWDAAFVEGALGVDDAKQFARQDDFAALIIGKLSTLRYELEETVFGVQAGRRVPTGHIEDLIRTKKFADDPAGETFRTEVLSDRARELDEDVAALDPPVVIFDGARAFEKHHWSWPNTSWVVILDQSDEAVGDGAVILNSLYAQRTSDADPMSAMDIPPGVEFTSFLGRSS